MKTITVLVDAITALAELLDAILEMGAALARIFWLLVALDATADIDDDPHPEWFGA